MEQQKQVLNMKVTVEVYDEATATTVSASAGTNYLVEPDQINLRAQRLAEKAVRLILARR